MVLAHSRVLARRECNGALRETEDEPIRRYRCRVAGNTEGGCSTARTHRNARDVASSRASIVDAMAFAPARARVTQTPFTSDG